MARERWREAREKHKQYLMEKLGLSVEELALAETKPYFSYLARWAMDNGVGWKDVEPILIGVTDYDDIVKILKERSAYDDPDEIFRS